MLGAERQESLLSRVVECPAEVLIDREVGHQLVLAHSL
jgi:hypothetical protein